MDDFVPSKGIVTTAVKVHKKTKNKQTTNHLQIGRRHEFSAEAQQVAFVIYAATYA